MKIANILDICEANEISLKVVGDNLKVVSKAGRLSDEIKLLLKDNKATIIEMLRASHSDADDQIPAVYTGDPAATYALSSPSNACGLCISWTRAPPAIIWLRPTPSTATWTQTH